MGRIKKISERIFVIILSEHRLWGPLFMPWFIEKESGNDYYSPAECLSPYASPESLEQLDEVDIELIEIINSYSDRHLFRLFSREKTVVEFTEKIDDKRFQNHIKPYIERKLYKCFEIISNNNIVTYRQKTGTSNLHEDDILNISDHPYQPVFLFHKGSEYSSYKLEITQRHTDKTISLLEKDIQIICNSPCVLRYGDELNRVEETEGTKLVPFLSKEKILIPEKHTREYFAGFVKNIINQHAVIPSGFEITEAKPDKSVSLTLETGIRNIPVLLLKFNYNSREIFYDNKLRSFTFFEDGENYIFTKISRDTEWENSCIDYLNELGFYSEDNKNFMVPGRSGEKEEELYSLVEYINNHYNELVDNDFELRHGSLEKNYNLSNIDLNIDHKLEKDWFDLEAIVRINGKEIPFIKFRNNILENKREYFDEEGVVYILPEEWFTRYRELFELGEKKENILRVHKQHFSLLNDIFNEDECNSCPALEKLVLPDEVPDVEIPHGLMTAMRDYQHEGLKWLSFLQSNGLGACLADDMGLGKTIQTLALLLRNKEMNKDVTYHTADQPSLFEEGKVQLTSLLVVPASLVYNWENEIERFAPSLKTYSYRGNQRKKNSSYFPEFDIILSSYHTVRQDIDIISSFSFHYVVLDESQLIKNPASQLYKAISRLKSDHKLVLSGTPVENSLTDLWTQLNFVNKGLLGSLAYFKREFSRPIEKAQSHEKEEKLSRIIKPFILRRTKEEVTRDLPPVSENMVYCDMSEEQYKKYEEEKSAVRNTIIENVEMTGMEKSAIIVLQGLMKLRQISNHPVLADPDYNADSGKFNNVIHDIEAVIAEGHKILVFSSFVRHLDLFAKEFQKKKLEYTLLTGSTSGRGKTVEKFQEDRNINIFLISLKAGGIGLNLTAADYVFILDPWWNPAAEIQALSRAHRIGQVKNVFVKRYISTHSIEEKIVKLQQEKSRLARTFVSTNNPLKEMDFNDILELIG